MSVLIYKICCPISYDIKYIGQTTSDLGKRLKQHISKPTGNSMYNFFKDCDTKGFTPIIERIESVSFEEANAKEQYWIDLYRNNGVKLLNGNQKVNTKINLFDKKRDISLPKRFNSEDVKKWQEQANLTTGGNLTLWMENALNNAVKKQNVKSKQ